MQVLYNTNGPVTLARILQISSGHLVAKMREQQITRPNTIQTVAEDWIDLKHSATVEVTSEDKNYPIESALSFDCGQGWRAAEPGVQTIRVFFDNPQEIRRISLVFEEEETTRTQEFVLRSGGPLREIVRQQWNFNAPASVRESEEYRVGLSHVSVLELTIVPNIGGGVARASLKSLHLS